MRPPGGSRPPDRRSPRLHALDESLDGGRPPSAPAEAGAPRQRWRVAFRRAAEPARTQRDDLEAWQAALKESGLPLAAPERPGGRLRLSLGPPLPAGMAGERELIDVGLAKRLPIAPVRLALGSHMPAGAELIDLHDVWVGAPALPSQVRAADYRVCLERDAPGAAEIEAAARRLLEASALPRARPKGGGSVRYDLRPLLADLQVTAPGPPIVLRIRTRFDPQLGTGRPGEVLDALGELVGRPLAARFTVRERLLLASDAERHP